MDEDGQGEEGDDYMQDTVESIANKKLVAEVLADDLWKGMHRKDSTRDIRIPLYAYGTLSCIITRVPTRCTVNEFIWCIPTFITAICFLISLNFNFKRIHTVGCTVVSSHLKFVRVGLKIHKIQTNHIYS